MNNSSLFSLLRLLHRGILRCVILHRVISPWGRGQVKDSGGRQNLINTFGLGCNIQSLTPRSLYP